MELPTIDILAKDVAEKALDGFIYEGKTLREWVEIIVKQQPCEDCISREAVEKITWEEPSYDDALNVLTEVRDKVRALPSVTPQPFINKPCVSEGVCHEDKMQVLDKIRAEIEQVSFTHYFEHGEYYGEDTRQERIVNFDTVMQIIDKYKTESEE